MENLDIKQTSCQDGLSQGVSNLAKKITFTHCQLDLQPSVSNLEIHQLKCLSFRANELGKWESTTVALSYPI